MLTLDLYHWLMVFAGAGVLAIVVLRGIGQGAVYAASEDIYQRREFEKKRRQENAEAVAAGRAAALEPLALNADGTIEEPVVGVVENR